MKVRQIHLILSTALMFNSAFSLSFGTMGNTSAGMGGAGVALKDSAWGLYYNPALLGADRRAKFGYSLGVQVKSQNLLELAAIDVDNLKNLSATLTKELTGPASGGASVTIGGKQVSGAVGGMVEALFGKTTINTQDVETFAKDLASGQTAPQGCNQPTDIGTCFKNISKDTNLVQKFKDKVVDAANQSGSPLVGSIIDNIEPSKLGDVLADVSSGNFSADSLLDKAGGITLKKGADPVIDKFLEDFENMNAALSGNDLDISTQNGIVFVFSGSGKTKKVKSDNLGELTINEVTGSRGAVGVGLFLNAYVNASAAIDPKHNKLIIKTNNKEYEAAVSGDAITLKVVSSQFDNSSILSPQANHTLYANSLVLAEIPIGYGHTIFTPLGELNVGLAVKFMQATGFKSQKSGNFDNMSSLTPDIDANAIRFSNNFAFDVGTLWTPSFLDKLNLGFVVKNINAPKITDDITLNRQIRAGASYSMLDFLTFAVDYDVLPNNTLSLTSPKSQFLGGGVLANFKVLDVRLGAMKDFRSNAEEGIILTGGLNVFGFLDVAVQYGLGKSFSIMGYPLSNYMQFRVGGSFTF